MKEMLAQETLWNTHGKYDGNTSGIFSALIRESGRVCEHYASDILIDIRNVEETLCADQYDVAEYVEHGCEPFMFGFRRMGVDGNSFIRVRGIDSTEYVSVYCLEVEYSNSGYGTEKLKLSLYKIR